MIGPHDTQGDIFLELRKRGIIKPIDNPDYTNHFGSWVIFCDYHQNFDHSTEDCSALKQKMVKLIMDGKLEIIIVEDTVEGEIWDSDFHRFPRRKLSKRKKKGV